MTNIDSMDFFKFNFSENLNHGLEIMGFKKATPVQKEAIPLIQKNKDIIACAQTGTGKTAAFVLPILDKQTKIKRANKVNTIIIAPTRELAKQIDRQIEGFSYFVNSTSYPIYGGGDGIEFDKQKKALINGTDIIICTPGRLMAHLDFNYFDTSGIEHFILDEADRMLDMGFYDDIISIAKKLPKKCQTLMFSATMPVKIRKLANKLLINPVNINIAISKPASKIKQTAYYCKNNEKVNIVKNIIKQKGRNSTNILIFCSSIKSVKEINKMLTKHRINSSEMHSGLNQKEREETIRNFENKKNRILITTDILSRGIDIKDIELVINYEVPKDVEDYIHRIGRTARANKNGEAITLVHSEQMKYFKKIENFINKKIPVLKFIKKIQEI